MTLFVIFKNFSFALGSFYVSTQIWREKIFFLFLFSSPRVQFELLAVVLLIVIEQRVHCIELLKFSYLNYWQNTASLLFRIFDLFMTV